MHLSNRSDDAGSYQLLPVWRLAVVPAVRSLRLTSCRRPNAKFHRWFMILALNPARPLQRALTGLLG
jgi:hypothetical protein